MNPDVYLARTYVQDRQHEIAQTRLAEAGAAPRAPRQHWWTHLHHHTPTSVLTPSPQAV
jgi:hypothetical protein